MHWIGEKKFGHIFIELFSNFYIVYYILLCHLRFFLLTSRSENNFHSKLNNFHFKKDHSELFFLKKNESPSLFFFHRLQWNVGHSNCFTHKSLSCSIVLKNSKTKTYNYKQILKICSQRKKSSEFTTEVKFFAFAVTRSCICVFINFTMFNS